MTIEVIHSQKPTFEQGRAEQSVANARDEAPPRVGWAQHNREQLPFLAFEVAARAAFVGTVSTENFVTTPNRRIAS